MAALPYRGWTSPSRKLLIDLYKRVEFHVNEDILRQVPCFAERLDQRVIIELDVCEDPDALSVLFQHIQDGTDIITKMASGEDSHYRKKQSEVKVFLQALQLLRLGKPIPSFTDKVNEARDNFISNIHELDLYDSNSDICFYLETIEKADDYHKEPLWGLLVYTLASFLQELLSEHRSEFFNPDGDLHDGGCLYRLSPVSMTATMACMQDIAKQKPMTLYNGATKMTFPKRKDQLPQDAALSMMRQDKGFFHSQREHCPCIYCCMVTLKQHSAAHKRQKKDSDCECNRCKDGKLLYDELEAERKFLEEMKLNETTAVSALVEC